MKTMTFAVAAASLSPFVAAAPMADKVEAHAPGYDQTYVDYLGKAPPYPGNLTAPINATASGPPGPDDLLFQNLLAAEWAIYSFYQTGVETFNTSAFTAAGYPNTTYADISRIRDNEAGHLKIFMDNISPTSLKPGPCKYSYAFPTPQDFMGLQVLLEITSETFLTGMVRQAKTNATRAALVAVAEVEARHNAWALIEAWGASPFVGPADTVFPYANQILSTTSRFIESCPAANPPYPLPDQHLPDLAFDAQTSDGRPGSNVTLTFPKAAPAFAAGKEYYAVFFHGVANESVPFDTRTNATRIPAFDDTGIIVAVVADAPGAPTAQSIVAGPLYLLEQPKQLTTKLN